MKYLKLASRIILGIIFLFSGFVKAVDPLGSAYKFSDYFYAFHLDFLDFFALPLGVLLSAFELLLGIALILGYRRRVTCTVLLWFMSIFTLLTLVLALFNPVSDCGCFGDALILTNWQTFFKNLVLMFFVGVLYFRGREEAVEGMAGKEWMVLGLVYVLACGFSVWNYRHLPLLDFRPFSVGTVIRDAMEIPEGAPSDLYETTLTYRNRSSGKERDFGMDDYPRDTSQWEFVTSESRLVKKGYEAPIHDFALMDAGGNDLVDRILEDPGYSLLMITHDLPAADEACLVRAEDWARLEILAADFSFYAVTASTAAETRSFSASLGLDYPFYAADDIMLKTIIRSNPGFLLIHRGAIAGKWACRDFPAPGDLDPAVTELLDHASAPVEEETMILMEAGMVEDFSFDVLDFASLVPSLLYRKGREEGERRAVLAFILSMGLLFALTTLIVPVKA